MASAAYQSNGVIVIWWDETEGGDTTNFSLPEIIISPLAKGNAYASVVPMNHSSDIKTLEEILSLPAVNNPIPTKETDVSGSGYNNVATVNDLSDLFVPDAIPAVQNVFVIPGDFRVNKHNQHVMQDVVIFNGGDTAVPYPLWLVLDDLSPNATLVNADGTTSVLAPLGSPYVNVRTGDGDANHDDVLRPNDIKRVTLEFLDPSAGAISYNTRALSVTPAP